MALVLVLGTLALLAVLASALVVLTGLERKAAAQRAASSRAILLARSGLEEVLGRIGAGQDMEEVTLERGSPVDCRIEVRGENGIDVNGGDVIGPGAHVGTYDVTLRRILGHLAEALGRSRQEGTDLVDRRPSGGWKDLDAVVRGLGWSPADQAAWEPYLAFEPWRDLKVIRPNLDPSWSPPEWTSTTDLTGVPTAGGIADFASGRRDPSSDSTIPPPRGIGPLWAGKRALNPHTASCAPDFERDRFGHIVGRAPVNLNWAIQHPAALRALLRDLGGVWRSMEQASGNGYNAGGYLAALFTIRIPSAVDGLPGLDALVDAFRGGAAFTATERNLFPDWDGTPRFDSWEEFRRFVDFRIAPAFTTAPATVTAQWMRTEEAKLALRDLLKAHFNPNSGLVKGNPGESMALRLDKSDLTAYSTEFCFRTPVLRVSSEGRVRTPDGRLLARHTCRSRITLHQVRLTTQSEFCAGDLGVLSVAGDEARLRLPGEAGFIDAAVGQDPASGAARGGRGQALQTYPEPQWAGGGCPPPAVWDGSLQLATLELGRVPGLTFLASWDDGLDADLAAGSATCITDVATGTPGASILGRGSPLPSGAVVNPLRPDGCYAEALRAVGYEAPRNLGDGLSGLMSVWVKPSYGLVRGPSAYLRDIVLVHLSRYEGSHGPDPWDPRHFSTVPFGNNTQSFALGLRRRERGLGYAGFIVESRGEDGDTGLEGGPLFGWAEWNDVDRRSVWSANRWTLLTVQWDLRGSDPSTYATLVVNHAPHRSAAVPRKDYGYMAGGYTVDGGGPDPEMNRLTRNAYRGWREPDCGTSGPPRFYLGRRGGTPALLSGEADATFDELACLTRTTDMGEAALLADARWSAGRYYKEDRGASGGPEWQSAPLRLPEGSLAVRLDWTLILPRVPAVQAIAPDYFPPANRVFFGTGANAMAGETADAEVRLLEPGSEVRMSRPGGVSLRVSGDCRLGANLRPRLGDNVAPWSKLDAPLIESPVLDDLTLTYLPPGGPVLSVWSAR